jgi:hypothetical protein
MQRIERVRFRRPRLEVQPQIGIASAQKIHRSLSAYFLNALAFCAPDG